MKAYLSFPHISNYPTGFSGLLFNAADRGLICLRNSICIPFSGVDRSAVAGDANGTESYFTELLYRQIGHKTVMGYVSKTYQF